jgi:hypothetical protein
MSGRRGEWGAVFLLISPLPAIEAVARSRLGVVQVEGILVGFR